LCVQHARRPGEESDLGEDLARHDLHVLERSADQLSELGRRQRSAEAVAADDGDPAREDHEHAGAGLTHPAEEFARLKALLVAEMPDPVDLGRRKDREHLLKPRGQRGAALLLGGHVKG